MGPAINFLQKPSTGFSTDFSASAIQMRIDIQEKTLMFSARLSFVFNEVDMMKE